MDRLFSLDRYAELILKNCLTELEKNRAEINQPVNWIKLQQGGRGQIHVSHIQLNHGENKRRNRLHEKSFGVSAYASFPAWIENFSECEQIEAYVKRFFGDIERESEAFDDVLETIYGLFSEALIRQLLIVGSKIKEALKKQGLEISADCVVCCGSSDNTWGWHPELSFDPDEVLQQDSVECLSEEQLWHLAKLFYAEKENQDWLMKSIASEPNAA